LVRAAIAVALTSALTLGVVEGAYRGYLWNEFPQRFRQSDPALEGAIGFISPPPSTYSARRGFDYLPNTEFIQGLIRNGAIEGCSTVRTNSTGGWGRDGTDYASADFRVLVVGDSFTASAPGGVTWTNVLEERLAAQTGRRAAVRNLARDGQGVLNMIDIAADEITRTKPDLIVLAYITDDLTRARIWRRIETYEGKLRQFTTTSGDAAFDPSQSVDAQVVVSGITKDWCVAGRKDALVQDIVQRKVLAVAHAGARADLFDLRRSFAADVVRYNGDPFGFYEQIAAGRISTNPRHALASFEEDARAAEAIASIRASGAPVVLYHLAYRSHLRQGLETSATPHETRLVASLEAAFNRPSIPTMPNLPAGTDIERIGIIPSDDHPSRYGVDIYAETLLNGLAKTGKLVSK